MENIPQKKGMHPVWIFVLCVIGCLVFLSILGKIFGPEEGITYPTVGNMTNISGTVDEKIDLYTNITVLGSEKKPIGELVRIYASDKATDKELQAYCNMRLDNDTYMVNFYNSMSGGSDNIIGTCTTPSKIFSRFTF